MIFSFLALVLFLFLFSSSLAAFYIDFLWFQTLGYTSRFWTVFFSRVVLGVAVGLLFAGSLFLNGWIAKGSLRRLPENVIPYPYERFFLPRRLTLILAGVSLGVGLLAGLALSGQWLVVQNFFQGLPFGKADPLFGLDISFFVFKLPFYRLVLQLLNGLLFITFLLVAGLYIIGGFASFRERRFDLHPKARAHLLVLLSGFFLFKAGTYLLRKYDLVYSPRGVAFGASYTDITAQLPALNVLTIIAFLVAVTALISVFSRGLRLLYGGVILLLLASLALGSLYPAAVQQFVVRPNEREKEASFIEKNIRLTREAYNLDQIKSRPFAVDETLTRAAIEQNRATLDNIRLWDYRVLKATYQQMQTLRPYYNFQDVDIDRYEVGGRLRQVLLAAREINPAQIPEQARTWVNLRLQYTHGYGIVMSPAAEVSQEGLPAFLVRDLPPRSVPGLEITRPEIYYGEQTADYVIVKTDEKEFDYPSGDQNVLTVYAGQGGVSVGSYLRRLAFALVLDDYNLLLTGSINPDSRVMLYRNIRDRVRKIAPFLMYDRDPYLVLDDGRLFWIQDAYTISSNYPYSEPTSRGRLNYIRNSVKVVVDAYNGDVTFYQFEDEPVVNTLASIFPDLFKPVSEMPANLKKHVRYPEDLFLIQAEMYSLYHMQDPRVFYNKEDLWTFPRELFGEQEVTVEPYYVIMQLPGEKEPEFLLMVPFTPRDKNIMISWLAARMDGEKFGELLVFNFPKTKTVFGPRQIESRIDQDAQISSQLTLWSQRGSQVIRGNLLVIPLGETIIYVEPLYLQATGSNLPELRRVIVAFGNRLAMAETLEQALDALFGPAGAVQPPEVGAEVPEPAEITTRELIERAARLFNEAQEALRRGDWASYGSKIDELGRVLEDLTSFSQGAAMEGAGGGPASGAGGGEQ